MEDLDKEEEETSHNNKKVFRRKRKTLINKTQENNKNLWEISGTYALKPGIDKAFQPFH